MSSLVALRVAPEHRRSRHVVSESPGLPITRTASANQNRASQTLLGGEDPEDWPPRLPHKLKLVSLLSWCFKPSQPQRILSGLRETFVKRYILERTNQA